jgi:hypothetical protein
VYGAALATMVVQTRPTKIAERPEVSCITIEKVGDEGRTGGIMQK